VLNPLLSTYDITSSPMDIINKAIPKLHRNRAKGWEYLASIIPDKQLVKAINQHVRDINKLNKIKVSSGYLGTSSPIKNRINSIRGSRRCKGCKQLLPHVGPVERKKHLWSLEQRNRVNKSWKNYPPGSLARRLRMEPAWKAWRKRKTDLLLSQTNPRLIEIFGKTQIMKRYGRDLNPAP
jgi:hypothetical protein